MPKKRKAPTIKIINVIAKHYYNQVKRYGGNYAYDFMDFVQEGYITSMNCQENYNPKKNDNYYKYLSASLNIRFRNMIKGELEKVIIEKTWAEVEYEIKDCGEIDLTEMLAQLFDTISKEIKGDARVLLNLISNTPQELLNTAKYDGTVSGKQIAKFLAKNKHGEKWNPARVSLAYKNIREVLAK